MPSARAQKQSDIAARRALLWVTLCLPRAAGSLRPLEFWLYNLIQPLAANQYLKAASAITLSQGGTVGSAGLLHQATITSDGQALLLPYMKYRYFLAVKHPLLSAMVPFISFSSRTLMLAVCCLPYGNRPDRPTDQLTE